MTRLSTLMLAAGVATMPVATMAQHAAPLAPQHQPPSPADLFGPLFVAVQTQKIFPDGKTFVDAVPKRDPAAIMADFDRARIGDLKAFVLANFTVPGVNDHEPKDLRAHVRSLWPMLVRQPVPPAPGSSALPLPEPYVVPGGRFREMYYWDSYFTMLGLAADGQQPLVESMLADFTATIERYAHIPNGMRSYYLSRSQPPFYALMLDLSKDTDPALAARRLAARRLAALRREHDYWMRGGRVVTMPDGSRLNRYWDDRDTPRDESYAEDVATAAEAARAGRDPATVRRDLRAAAESGWDFSSRWLADGKTLATIRTTQIVPVDLNSLMLAMEERIATRCRAAGDQACAAAFTGLATKRRAAIQRYLWAPREGRFADRDMATRRPTPAVTAAILYPLFVGAATPAQAKATAVVVRAQLLGEGGLRTTTRRTGQQWDEPNGWAPLQWIAIDGLARNGEEPLAKEIARRWMTTVARTYAETGKMLEKYDVAERKSGGGGEYPTQDGFGWTNGVASAIDSRWPGLLADLPSPSGEGL
ncbi:alpha,alpha-trehalase TreA [Sphingomonas sp. XXL09]|uniref:alpha,alpha-trehalase TreA n=1 Tax=Sphingomonas sp. XXL09 TaxID=3457787 RepID=UPI00406BAB34